MNARQLAEYEYEVKANAHLDATVDFLEEVMGRPPTFPEISAVWAQWIKNLYKDAGQST